MRLDTPLPDGYRFRPLTADDHHDVLDLDAWAFPVPVETEEMAKMPSPLTWERAVGVQVDGDTPDGSPLAAMHASYPFTQFPVPGGTLPTAGLTWVGVHPQHRRRGLASAMIDLHLARCRERGEPLSALYAAEYAIYGRFGYGRAADDVRVTLPRGAALRDVPGASEHTVRIEHADAERHRDLVLGIHRAAGQDVGGLGLNRPGWAGPETAELQAHRWYDPAAFRQGFESRRLVVVERDGEPRGYALLRRKLDWDVTGPRGTVNVAEAVALDTASSRALWGVLVDLDLMSETKPFLVAPDDPLLSLLVDRRGADLRISDNVWVRVVDVPTALAGRRYAADLDVTLAVTDTRLPDNEGVWHLRAEAFGPASCTASETAAEEADLALDIRELGAAYLGGTALTALAAAGLVTEQTPESLARASTAFGWPVAPMCSWVF
ncbi:GNAT family N-acetyltransferase [Isoptericola sp. b515]|uniref:GNAT family N-acetyltransferase n=1 Tax=Isoptericola sp. b515 TaxID=3064652 RepID=UPI0027144023|nr:GNAT family N-acetyltransferase [Isoptericola sp. b515]MDO8148330.1 GNAT family N-acetyltransferase [Isoptericola sp. b515]